MSDKLTIDEVRKLKNDADILVILCDLHEKTGCLLNSVDVKADIILPTASSNTVQIYNRIILDIKI